MLVVVKTLFGTNVELEVDPTDTLLHLKELITNETGWLSRVGPIHDPQESRRDAVSRCVSVSHLTIAMIAIATLQAYHSRGVE